MLDVLCDAVSLALLLLLLSDPLFVASMRHGKRVRLQAPFPKVPRDHDGALFRKKEGREVMGRVGLQVPRVAAEDGGRGQAIPHSLEQAGVHLLEQCAACAAIRGHTQAVDTRMLAAAAKARWTARSHCSRPTRKRWRSGPCKPFFRCMQCAGLRVEG